jgi:hypothetical protein
VHMADRARGCLYVRCKGGRVCAREKRWHILLNKCGSPKRIKTLQCKNVLKVQIGNSGNETAIHLVLEYLQRTTKIEPELNGFAV